MGGFFKNNRLLFSLVFSENCCGGDKAAIKGDKVVIGRSPSPSPTRESPASYLRTSTVLFTELAQVCCMMKVNSKAMIA